MKHKRGDLRVWWSPQIPMPSFYVPVDSVIEGVKIMHVLAYYDIFQFENHIKLDYTNMGGLQMFDESDDTENPGGSWVDWYDEELEIDDPEEYLTIRGEIELAEFNRHWCVQ